MIKSFLIFITLKTLLFSSQQLLLVIADNTQTSKAIMYCLEENKIIFPPINVNIGANGLGLGLGEKEILENNTIELKFEGDKKAPIGIFKLSSVFGYEKKLHIKMPYIHADDNLICVDDTNSSFYNKIITIDAKPPKSYEKMRRNDDQYKLGIVVDHNQKGLKKRGSCIFVHVQKTKNAPTAGCTSMEYENLEKIVHWLDPSKDPIMIQIPYDLLSQIKKIYPDLDI